MTKIYEALEQADKEQARAKKLSVVKPSPDKARRISDVKMEKTLTGLYQNMTALLPDEKSRIVQFISAQEGEGTSTLIREFAKFSALKLKKQVSLLDTDINDSTQVNYFNVNPARNWEEIDRKRNSVKEALSRIGQSSLYIGHIPINCDSLPLFELPRCQAFFEALKLDFELILIDSPSATRCPDSLLLTRNVDGVVLIVEAEKSRWQAVDKVKERIVTQGGNILGVILNKKRYPIPDFIYNKI